MSAEIADVLDKAAVYITVNGWHQGGVGRGVNGEACALVAIGCVADGDGYLEEDAVDALTARIPGTSIAYWNDAPGQTADEVIAALRAAAASERAS